MNQKTPVFVSMLLNMLLAISMVVAASAARPLVDQPDDPDRAAVAGAAKHATGLSNTETVIASTIIPETLDPALDYETAGGQILNQIYERLVFFNRENANELIPMLATNWEISPTGDEYTFTIRQGVHFHNGNDLTPEDVAYSFQRGLLQGGSVSPQWLFAEPLLGLGISDISLLVDPSGAMFDDRAAIQQANSATLLTACQAVKDAVTFDNANWTVTFHLTQGWGPFLATLAQPWGSIVDKDWVIQNDGWDGSCGAWQNYYAMSSEEDPLTSITNGTGPYTLGTYNPQVEIVLLRNENYWRTTPMWEGGPSGPALLERVVLQNVPDTATRLAMLLNGDADFADQIDLADAALADQILFRYDEPSGLVGELVHPDGSINLYTGGLVPSSMDALFNYAINPESPYIGSGQLDGNGIPPEFFTDIHVRKAFSYAFDWDQYIQDVYHGGAIQRRGPIIKGLTGYRDDQPVYSYDPVKAQLEFAQAWGGQVSTIGFTLTIPYNFGNSSREGFANLIKSRIELLSPNYHVNVVGLDWTDYLTAQRSQNLTFIISGWYQDIPHPYNWVQPYMIGTYAGRQNLPAAMQNSYQTQINECLPLVGDAAEICYQELQNMTYEDATDIFLTQPVYRRVVRAEVRGFYNNDALYGPYYYAFSKGPAPIVNTINPGDSQTVTFESQPGTTISLPLPAGSVSSTIELVVDPIQPLTRVSTQFMLTDLTFGLDAYLAGEYVENFVFNQPVILTIAYSPEILGTFDEDSLTLLWWNGQSWEDAACGDIIRNPVENTLQVPICHLSDFGLGTAAEAIFLPLLAR